MAAPALIVAIPAIFSALWSGLLILGKWLLEHAHITKVIVVCMLIIAAFATGRVMHGWVMNAIDGFVTNISETQSGAPSMSLQILAKANYCLPISEMLGLLGNYVLLAGYCLSLKGIISMWRSTPFKSA